MWTVGVAPGSLAHSGIAAVVVVGAASLLKRCRWLRGQPESGTGESGGDRDCL